jgi:hypothetical protein
MRLRYIKIITDPYPGGQKTNGFCGSETRLTSIISMLATVVLIFLEKEYVGGGGGGGESDVKYPYVYKLIFYS